MKFLMSLILLISSSVAFAGRYDIDSNIFYGNGWTSPLSGALTTSTNYDYDSSVYLSNWGYHHGAYDFVSVLGNPVYAIDDGEVMKVVRKYESDNNTSIIYVKHKTSNGTEFLALYGHTFAKDGIEASVIVKQGDEIGYITRMATPDHIHFGISTNTNDYTYSSWGGIKGGIVNPVDFLQSNKNTALTYFDGAGSLISPSNSGDGADTDLDAMHPHSGRLSTVVFQFKYASNCEHIDISSTPTIDAIIQAKYWGEHEIPTAFGGTLPMSVPNKGSWTVVAVTSTQPLSQKVNVRATCKSASSPSVNNIITPLSSNETKLVALDNDYFWTGTGSIMSYLGTGTGKSSDVVPTFISHKSLSSFQWYVSSSCPRLYLSADSGNSVAFDSSSGNEVASKIWNASSWTNHSSECSGLPCTISVPSQGYYIVKVKTNANALNGGLLRADCAN